MSNNEEEIIRVAVVDDQRLFTKGLSGLVDMLPGVEVVGVAFDGEQAVALCRVQLLHTPSQHIHMLRGHVPAP